MGAHQRRLRRKKKVGKRLAAYALAAGAVSVGGGKVSAAPVYNGLTNIALGGNQSFLLDLNSDGTDDFALLHVSTTFSGRQAGFIKPLVTGNAVVSTSTGNSFYIPVAALIASSTVGSGKPFATGGSFPYLNLASATSLGSVLGVWAGAGQKFAGLKFKIGTATHFGWIRLTMSGGAFDTAKLGFLDSGYESSPDTVIHVGAGAPPGDVPEPSSLGLLALGSLGVLALRRRRKRKEN